MQDLDLGTVTLGPGTWSNATVSLVAGRRIQLRQCQHHLHRRNHVVAQYNVQGSNKQTVQISAPNVTLGQSERFDARR